MKSGYQKYKKTSVESASREKLLLLMYEAAIKYVKRASAAIEQNDIAERGKNIGFAFDVIMELNNTLDHTVGGDVATNLEQLYMFLTEELTKANIEASRDRLVKIEEILMTLYSGWQEAIEQLKKSDNNKKAGGVK